MKVSNRQLWSEWDDAALRALHEGGWPIETAAWYFERTENAVRQHARNMGLRFVGAREKYSADEDETLRINYPTIPAFVIAHVLGKSRTSVNQRARCLGVKKSPDFYKQWHTPLWHAFETEASKAARFKKGMVPANKGVRRPGWAPGRMAESQFKKGQMSGAAQHNYVPIGTERIKDNVLCRKMTDDPTLYPARRCTPPDAGCLCTAWPGRPFMARYRKNTSCDSSPD